ncbi:MAG: hypothetical protein WCT53_06055 [Candidatus Gracilibacteria bacterium]
MEKPKVSLIDRITTGWWLVPFLVLLIVQILLMWNYSITVYWINVFITITASITGVVLSLFVLRKLKFSLPSRKAFACGFLIISLLLLMGTFLFPHQMSPLNKLIGELFSPVFDRYMGMVSPIVDNLLYMFMMLFLPFFVPLFGGILIMIVQLISRRSTLRNLR